MGEDAATISIQMRTKMDIEKPIKFRWLYITYFVHMDIGKMDVFRTRATISPCELNRSPCPMTIFFIRCRNNFECIRLK